MSVMDGPSLPAPAWDCPPLPTVEECQEFLRLVNAGRVAVGAEPLAVLDFDGAAPCSSSNCLSARNLFSVGRDSECHVGGSYVVTVVARPMADAIGMEDDGENDIPDAILKVTDPFDSQTPGLRARLVEAGVVAP